MRQQKKEGGFSRGVVERSERKKKTSKKNSSPLTSERLRRLVDPQALRQLPVRLERARLLGAVLEDHVRLAVLVVAQADEHDVAGVDPDLLAHLAADVREALDAVDALRVEAVVAEHLEDLGVLLAVLLEDELALLLGVVLAWESFFFFPEFFFRFRVLFR